MNIPDFTLCDGIRESLTLAGRLSIRILFMQDGSVLISHICDRRPSNVRRSSYFRGDAGAVRLAPKLQLGSGHTIEQRDPLTVSFSVLCADCGMHGFNREGKWWAV